MFRAMIDGDWLVTYRGEVLVSSLDFSPDLELRLWYDNPDSTLARY